MKYGGPSYPNPLSSPPHWCPWNLFRSFKVCSDAKERVGSEKQREAIAPIKFLVKLQPWPLSLRCKTCLRQNCILCSCACSEGAALGQNTQIYIYIYHRVFCPKAGPSLQGEKPRLQFCQRQVFHHKLRNQGCSSAKGRSSTANSGTKASVLPGIIRCGSFPLLSAPYFLFSI